MNDWSRVQELFEETVALSEAERERVLAERLGERTDLARTVRELVERDRTPFEALDAGVSRLLEGGEDDAPQELVGCAVGAYRFERLVASGGMGHVYEGTRTSADIERRVAIKVLRGRDGARDLLWRFQRERATLASLEHEHIVAFLDAGALPDGRPFLVMEYVDGSTLGEWCRDGDLPLARRVELFLDVLGAVQYAHQNLIVHRDLKPSNVLVSRQGVPKLLDFGVAHVLGERGGEAEEGRVPYTYGYASPERLRGERGTPGEDVFSLGALLYECLAGVPAFPGPAARDPEALPPAPSAAARAAGHPERARALAGDLDRIVLRALAPRRAERYATAALLADDLGRHLRGEAVHAHPPTAWYRARKFCRRNRLPLASGLALVLVLAAGWLGAAVGRERALRDASRGWRAHAEARRVVGVFEEALARAAEVRPEVVPDILEDCERALAQLPAGWDETEAVLRLALARLWADRGRSDAALRHLERVLELDRAGIPLGNDARERARALRAALRGSAPEPHS